MQMKSQNGKKRTAKRQFFLKWSEEMKKISEAQKKASIKYDKANTKGLYLKLNINTDSDILERLEEVENKQNYIKRLIRNDIKSLEK